MTGRRSRNSTDRITSIAILMAGVICGILVFVVALPLALSSPFPTPKQGEWILQTTSSDGASPDIRPFTTMARLSPPPMEPLPVDASETTGTLGARAPAAQPLAFAARWELATGTEDKATEREAPRAGRPIVEAALVETPSVETPRAETPVIEVPTQITRIAPDKMLAPPPAKHREVGIMEAVDSYLWEVYQRLAVKSDSSGDFTWKDPAAAKKRGMSLESYVIGGMDPDFREQLYHAGHAMDASGIRWSMLSAFRDDYRQALASGFKAHGGYSQHGGSIATGGYGHGRAIDITTASGEPETVWHWIDAHGAQYGLRRPMPGYDPAHIQPRSSYHELAHQLRDARIRLAEGLSGADPAAAKLKVASRSDDTNERHHSRH